MKFGVEVQKSKVFLWWEDIKADCYRIFSKIDGNFIEYAKVQGENFTTLSNLPIGQNECYVQGIKNGIVIGETQKVVFLQETFDFTSYNSADNKIGAVFSKYPECDGYRLYKSENGNGFNGVRNYESENILIDFVSGAEFKIKPYKYENGNRVFLCQSGVFNSGENYFKNVTVYKSFGDNSFISWNFAGNADGFLVFSEFSNLPIFETSDGLRHYALLQGFNSDTKFCVKAFVNSINGRVIIAESEFVQLRERPFDKPEVSLIIPAYNSKDYLARSIDSALASDFTNLEIIVVNDGSTDSTQEIIDWYAQNYENVISIQKENGGVADTRNVGINAARGAFIAFMDNDDLIRSDMMSTLYDSITKNNCDIAVAPLYRLIDRGYTKHCVLPFEPNAAHDIDKYLEIMYTPGFYNAAIWNKLYRASIVKEHPLGILKYEDVSWTPCIVSWAKSFCFVDMPFYEWDRKTRPETFGDVLAKMPEDELFEHRRQAMMFFVEQGNPEKLEQLKIIAQRRLARYAKRSSHAGYNELIKSLT